jgi:hypothetical protein
MTDDLKDRLITALNKTDPCAWGKDTTVLAGDSYFISIGREKIRLSCVYNPTPSYYIELPIEGRYIYDNRLMGLYNSVHNQWQSQQSEIENRVVSCLLTALEDGK